MYIMEKRRVAGIIIDVYLKKYVGNFKLSCLKMWTEFTWELICLMSFQMFVWTYMVHSTRAVTGFCCFDRVMLVKVIELEK